MLTSDLLRVRVGRKFIRPEYVDPEEASLLELARELIEAHRQGVGGRRGELEEVRRELTGDGTEFLMHRGLARLLEKRCRFEVQSDLPPVDLRRAVFEAATAQRRDVALAHAFDRQTVLESAAHRVGVSVEALEAGLFADLESEQRLVEFRALSPERLLHRYNVALAQTVLIRARRLVIDLPDEPPQRYRQIFRYLKFYRLMHRLEGDPEKGYRLTIDGPLSLFRYAQRYGLQMAFFLPVLLHARSFRLRAELVWGPRRVERIFELEAKDGLRSHFPDTGTRFPEELQRFADRFNAKVEGWTAAPHSEVVDLEGAGVFVPDFTFVHEKTGRRVWLELFGYWRSTGLADRLSHLRAHAPGPVLVGVSDRMRVDEQKLEGLPARVFRYREIPVVSEVARLLEEELTSDAKDGS